MVSEWRIQRHVGGLYGRGVVGAVRCGAVLRGLRSVRVEGFIVRGVVTLILW